MKNVLLILAIGLLLFSCSKSDDFTTEELAINANGSPTGYTFTYSSNQNMHTSNPIDSVTTVSENDKSILSQQE